MVGQFRGLDHLEVGVDRAEHHGGPVEVVDALAERSHNVVRWTEYERGGRFASLQAPDLLVEDIRAFCGQLT